MNASTLVRNSSAVRRFAIQAGILLLIATTIAVAGIYYRTELLVMSGLRQQARSFIDLVVASREWNARHGGVWVVKGHDSKTNPFLLSVGVAPDTSTVSGTELTLRNPAVMTKEISDIIGAEKDVRFGLIGVNPINEANRADSWERAQLQAFEQGRIDQAEEVVTISGRRVYRLLRPLNTDGTCIRCHGEQGYSSGDVRGAISVEVDMGPVETELRRNAVALAALWLLVSGALSFIMFVLVFRMASALERGESRLKVLATTDELTGLANRRMTMERLAEEQSRSRRSGRQLGLIELDIDHFKGVNDTYGHATGDAVLVRVSAVLREVVRSYDTVGRIGGEEFLVVAPDIDRERLAALAERLRADIEAATVTAEGSTLSVTASLGYTINDQAEDDVQSLLGRTDRALYEAKANGRNRVESA